MNDLKPSKDHMKAIIQRWRQMQIWFMICRGGTLWGTIYFHVFSWDLEKETQKLRVKMSILTRVDTKINTNQYFAKVPWQIRMEVGQSESVSHNESLIRNGKSEISSHQQQ